MEQELFNEELYHYGIKGMKWGVRRFQNKDGTRTPAGKKREAKIRKSQSSKERKYDTKKIAGLAIMTTTVATAAAMYGKNPAVRKTVNRFVSSAGKKTLNSLKTGSRKTVTLGKKYVKVAAKSAIEGVKEGIREAPKKVTNAVVTGAAFVATKRVLDKTIGKEEAAKIFQANNKKKISSFWKVSGDDRDDDD